MDDIHRKEIQKAWKWYSRHEHQIVYKNNTYGSQPIFLYISYGANKQYIQSFVGLLKYFFHENMYRAGTDKIWFHVTSEYTTNKTLQNRFWAELRRISYKMVIKVGDMDFPLKKWSISFLPIVIREMHTKNRGC